VIGQSPYKALVGSDPKIGLSSSSVPRDLLPDIQTEEDLQGIFEENSVSTDNIGTDTAISETEHNTDTESTGGISLPESALLRGFMQEGVMAIPASLTQLNSMTMVSVSNSMVGSLLSVELCAVT
jgi:hypothetical protein